MKQTRSQPTPPKGQPAYRKKLIEVALPLEAINAASAKEKSIRHGHPSTLHLWWARRPLAACRAVLFGQLVDDPSSVPEEFPTEEKQVAERERLFRIIEDLVQWKNSNDEEILYRARMEIARSVARHKSITFNKKMSKKEVLGFLAEHAPPVLDPFCGGGSIPLEAQRLGLRAFGSDLNPVAVLITKALIEIPPKFAGKRPVNPGQHAEDSKNVKGKAQTQNRFDAGEGQWKGARGIAEDIRYYGKWMRHEAEKHIGHLYPKIKLPTEKGGGEATVIAWLWARTVKCPNPACGAEMPLVRNFQLSSKKGKESYAIPHQQGKQFSFSIASSKPEGLAAGSKDRHGATCLACANTLDNTRLRERCTATGIGAQLMAVVAEGDRERIYLPPSTDQLITVNPSSIPDLDQELPDNARWFSPPGYGMKTYKSLFTPRQLVALTTFSDLVQEARERVLQDAKQAGLQSGPGIEEGGDGAEAYADAVATYLAFAINRISMTGNNLVRWNPVGQKAQHAFGRQALPMLWDFAEPNFLGRATGAWDAAVELAAGPLEFMGSANCGSVLQADARQPPIDEREIVYSTDPPYYDNIGYANLSDFFYVWIRRTLRQTWPRLTGTILTPKEPELIADVARHEGGRDAAREHFEKGMAQVFQIVYGKQAPDYPVSVFYAFKQAETDVGRSDADEDESEFSSAITASTGWETMLQALVSGGFIIDGTLPVRTEMATRQVAMGTNALASSIVLAARKRAKHSASATTRRDFQAALRSELPQSLKKLQQGYIAPVDLPQAAIGPGMAVFSRYEEVLVPDGSGDTRPMTVREALQLINQVLDEFLSEAEGDLDAETRVAVSWFEQRGFKEGPFGELEGLLKARNTATNAMVESGILKATGGKASLIPRDELPEDWDPSTDPRLTVWECLQHAIRVYRAEGSEACGALVAKMRGKAEDVRALAYRLYTVCERKKWADEARAYNELIADWLHIQAAAHRASSEWKGPLDQFGGES